MYADDVKLYTEIKSINDVLYVSKVSWNASTRGLLFGNFQFLVRSVILLVLVSQPLVSLGVSITSVMNISL